MTALIDSEYETPASLGPSIMSVAREMAGALTVSATFVMNLVIVAVARLTSSAHVQQPPVHVPCNSCMYRASTRAIILNLIIMMSLIPTALLLIK